MLKFIIYFLLFEIAIAQIRLTKDNLDQVCRCNSSQSTKIFQSNKNITTIDPSTFNGLNSLQYLDLSNNQLTTSTFNGLNSLQQLRLENNQITTIDPSTFNGLNSLYQLRLESNRITKIEEETFKDLISLTFLNIALQQLLKKKKKTTATKLTTKYFT